MVGQESARRVQQLEQRVDKRVELVTATLRHMDALEHDGGNAQSVDDCVLLIVVVVVGGAQGGEEAVEGGAQEGGRGALLGLVEATDEHPARDSEPALVVVTRVAAVGGGESRAEQRAEERRGLDEREALGAEQVQAVDELFDEAVVFVSLRRDDEHDALEDEREGARALMRLVVQVGDDVGHTHVQHVRILSRLGVARLEQRGKLGHVLAGRAVLARFGALASDTLARLRARALLVVVG